MTGSADDKRDFFVSFNQADRAWATWIAWTLEDAGYKVLFQDWDFTGNFVLKMHDALKRSRRMIAVLSPDYLTSLFTAPEWAAVFRQDPTSARDLLVPVRVRACEPDGLLAQIAYLDLPASTRDQARELLLKRVSGERPKPGEEPPFPIPNAPLPATARTIKQEPRFPTPIHNLPPHNPDFVGREEPLTELRRLLTSGQGPAVLTQAITGLGGIGKTQTALAYCYRHLADYRLIWWLRAESPATLAADFATLAEPLGLDPAVADQEKLLFSIRTALQATDRWLLVLDNVEDPGLPRRYLPSTGSGHGLITSRRSDWHGLARALPLEDLPEPEAVRLLTGGKDPAALSGPEQAEARALADDLGCLPLALAQARAYMAETGKSFAGYRKLLRASRPAVLAKGRASPDYPESVAKTWQVSIEAAEAACAGARPLLELLAFFAPEALPVELLAAKEDALPLPLRGELERDEAIGALNRLSLVKAGAGTITVHRLIQAVTRDGLDTATAKARVEAAVRLVQAALPRPIQEHTNWPAIGMLLPHVLAAASAAEPLYQRALAINEKTLGPEHPNVARDLNNLALLYEVTGRYAEAEPLYQRALASGEKTFGPDHPGLAIRLNNLAGLYEVTGRYAEAEPLYRGALTIMVKARLADHPHQALFRENYARLLDQLGRTDEAASLRAQATPPGPREPGGPK
jgi:tetratricopeptide (TPR) repeat protein